MYGFKRIISGIRRRLNTLRFSNSVFLVYSMGKVGSTSVYSSLQKSLPGVNAHHVHFLSDYWLEDVLPHRDKHFHQNIAIGNKILRELENQPGKKVKIITLVREPIGREISDMIENWKGLVPNGALNPTRMLNYVQDCNHDFALQWFDSEFNRFTGFDIYSVPFDRERGYTVYRTDRFEILCLKLEMIDSAFRPAFREFLGIDLAALQVRNRSTNKAEKDHYDFLKRRYSVDEAKLQRVYSSKYVRHFYSEKEIDRFVTLWNRERE